MMKEEDIIDNWKYTKVPWVFVPQEMKDWAMKHKQDMIRLSIFTGEFTETFNEFKEGYVYRLKEGYVKDSGFIETPIVNDGVQHFLYIEGGWSYVVASGLVEFNGIPVKFAGYKYENGNYSIHPYLPKGGTFSVEPFDMEFPTHVVFKKI